MRSVKIHRYCIWVLLVDAITMQGPPPTYRTTQTVQYPAQYPAQENIIRTAEIRLLEDDNSQRSLIVLLTFLYYFLFILSLVMIILEVAIFSFRDSWPQVVFWVSLIGATVVRQYRNSLLIRLIDARRHLLE